MRFERCASSTTLEASLGSSTIPTYAGASYAGNACGGANSGSLTSADGVFLLGSAVRLEDVADGTPNTAAFSERTIPP